MAKKKKSQFNNAIKNYFEDRKRSTGTTSKAIAAALDVSAQTVTSMSGKLDEASLKDVITIAEALGVDTMQFIVDIMALSETPNSYNSGGPLNYIDAPLSKD